MTEPALSDRAVRRPPLPRRAVLGAFLAAASVGTLVALGLLGNERAPQAAQFRFSRGVALDIGEETALRAYLAEFASDARVDLLFTGHTGTDGDPGANTDLSRARGEAARKIAQDMGVALQRTRVAAAGGNRPLDRPAGVSDREYQRSLARVTVTAQVVR